MESNLLNLPVEIFTENTTNEYTDNENITIGKMVDKYLKNDGFFILEIGEKFYGYLDLFSIPEIKRLNKLEHADKLLKDEKENIKFKTDYLKKDDLLKEAKKILTLQKTNFVPVLNKASKVIGRTNEEIINARIQKLLRHGFKLED